MLLTVACDLFAAEPPDQVYIPPKANPVANDSLPPLDIQNEYSNYVTRDEMEKRLSSLSWKKGPFTFTPYGYLWASANYDTGRAIPGEFALYIQSADIDDGPDFAVDARTSRIGMMIEGPSLGDMTLSGTVEIDFQGMANQTRNKGGLQLRKAFVQLEDKEREMRLMFGQNWEVISPLYPQMLAYLPAGFCGNIGYRRAQFRFEKDRTISPNFKILSQWALADDLPTDFHSTSGVSYSTSGIPTMEGRIAVSLWEQARGGLPITVGLSGHFGQQRYSFAKLVHYVSEMNKTIDTWSACLDLDVPLTKRLRIQGEYYYGADLSSFCGAILQGIDLLRRDAIQDQGGWLSIHTSLTKKLCNNTGFAIDTPDLNDLLGTVYPTQNADNDWTTYCRTKSYQFFTNMVYQWNESLMTGIEFSYMETDYRRFNITQNRFEKMAPGNSFRLECAVKMGF